MTELVWVLALVSRIVFSFADPAIDESSGLVDLGDLMVTINDSGDDAIVYIVDPADGTTVGRTRYADSVVDTEALAPAGPGHVWVGDIGDNTASRDHIAVYRVPVGRGERTLTAPSYRLAYPDGPRDAESMVFHDGRLYLITKGLLGGRMYVTPRNLDPDRVTTLEPVGTIGLWATDAALFPDARHILVRSYGSAAVYEFPSLKPVGQFDLPAQPQGEGVSIGPDGRIRLSSEGAHTDVLEIELPPEYSAAMASRPDAEPQPIDPVPDPRPDGVADPVADSLADWPLWVAGTTAVGSALVLIVWLAGGRRGGRRGELEAQ